MNKQNNEIVQKILTNTRWASMLRVIAQVFSWGVTIIVVRYLTPNDYGLNAMLESPLVLLALLSTLGLDTALVQKKSLSNDELRSVFGWLLLVNGAIFLMFFFGGGLLADYFNEPELETLAKVVAIMFLIIPFREIPNALLSRALDFKIKAQVELIAVIVASIVTLVLAIVGAGVWALIIGVLINRALQAVLMMILRPWFVMPSLNIPAVWQMMKFGGVVTLGGAILILSDRLAVLIAGPELGPEKIGIYIIGLEFAMLAMAKGMPIINQTILPAFAKFQDDRSAATYYFNRLLGVVSLLFIPLLIGMACVSEAFVYTVMGEKWVEVILPIAILSVGMVLRLGINLYRPVIVSMGRADVSLKINILQFILLLPLTYIAVLYGVLGLVFAKVVSDMIILIVTIQFSRKVLSTSISDFFSALKPALVASTVMAACVMTVYYQLGSDNQILMLIAQTIMGMVAYGVVIKFFYPAALQIMLKTLFGNRFA